MSARGALSAAALLVAIVSPVRGRAALAGELTGSWVMAQLSTSAARLPILGEIYARSRLVSLHRLRQHGDRLYGAGSLCELELDSGSLFVRTSLAPATKAHLPPPFVDARIGRDARGSLTFHQDKQYVVVGARLGNPLVDPLPRRASDPAVFDEDRDGQPGLTVEVGGILPGRLYVVQRSWTELSGTSAGADGFAGPLRFGNEQVVLQATSARLARAPASRAVPSRSWFRLQRIPDAAGCAAARALAAGWFE